MAARKTFTIRPQALYLFIMMIQFLILLTLLVPVFDENVFLLFLGLIFSMALRWRLDIKPVYMLMDQTVFMIISIFYPPGAMYLFIFGYYFSYKDKLIYCLPLIVSAPVVNGSAYYLLLLQGVLFGTILCHWEKESTLSKDTTDHLRRRIYDLESIQSKLLLDYQDTERILRLTERQRIAEILHDNLGHELTAAHLSLKAYKALLASNQLEKAETSLNKAEQRLDNALRQLKDSVSQIEPSLQIGLSDLSSLCENFIYPVAFTHRGDVLKLKPYIWQLVLMSVKEALTNITKHAHPKMVNISFDVTDHIVRLIIENDGINNNGGKIKGHGLRYMRSRLEAVNGSLSIQRGDTFKLIVIIPIKDGR